MTDLETAVDQLHAVPLEDFVAERKRLAKELRGAGERESAAALAKRAKPSAPAWALNSVARDEPDVIGGWLAAAETLRDASANADRQSGEELRAAMAAHREATRRVLATVRDHTRPNGRELSEQMLDRVRELLQAATGDPARAELLRAGRVVEGDEDAPPLPEPSGEAAPRPWRRRRPLRRRARRQGARGTRGGRARRARAARRGRRAGARRAARDRCGAGGRRGDGSRAARGGAPHAAPLGVRGGRGARGRRGGDGGRRPRRARVAEADGEALLVGCWA